MSDIEALQFIISEVGATKARRRMHRKQRELTEMPHKIRVAFGGNRTGKTNWGAQEVARYVLGTHKHRSIDLPVEVWCVSPSYDSQLDSTQKKVQQFIPQHIIDDISYAKKATWQRVTLKNGSVLTFKTYEQGREKFQGAGKRLIWFDEEPPRDIWEESIVRHEAGIPLDIILTMTPVNGLTWVYSELYLATSNDDIGVVVMGWDDNPWLTMEQKEQMSRGLTEESLQVRREGKFVRRVGLVATWWDRSVHLSPRVNVESGWNIYRVIDFGWSSSKSCVLWIGVDSYDQVYIFDGIYVNETEDEKLADMILRRENERGVEVLRSWADNQPERIAVLKRKGVICEPVSKKVSGDSWDVMRAEAMHSLGRVDPTTGKSRLIVSDTLTHYDQDLQQNTNWFVQEIETLRWQERKVDGQTQEKPRWDKDASPKGSHFDAIDTFSYFCVMHTKQGKQYRKPRGPVRKQKKKILNPLTGY